jgi:hypothetical protein
LGRANAVVSESGFFSVTVHAVSGMSFRENMAGYIVFMPHDDTQPLLVRRVVGRGGERLGFPANPQAGVHSGEYYLSDTFSIP